jgi:hypothetical protein
MKSAVPGIGSAYRDECENVGCMGVWERALLACRCKVAGALVAGALVALVAGALVGVMYTCWKRTLKIGCTGYARVMYVSCINITCSKSFENRGKLKIEVSTVAVQHLGLGKSKKYSPPQALYRCWSNF